MTDRQTTAGTGSVDWGEGLEGADEWASARSNSSIPVGRSIGGR